MMLSFTQKLQNYADLTVKVGIGLQPGQRLIVRAPVEAAPLARLITASAYQTGARFVEVMWHDDAITLARFRHAPRDSFAEFPAWRTDVLAQAAEQGDATLTIYSFDPDLLAEQDPELIALSQRIADEHMLPFRTKLMADEVNWCLISLPIPSWAAKIFPHDPPDTQMEKLWDIVFKVVRADQPDPIAAWQHHLANLKARQAYLNAKQYTALKYTAPGTNLTVGLPDNHLWKGGQHITHNAAQISFVANIPTEEVYTMPHKDKTNGVVAASKPLSYGGGSGGGLLIEDFSLTFENGRVVKANAKKGEDTLKKMLDTDEGARQLGEVALVPYSSPISAAGIMFYNTLFDENAASHLALGRAYRFTIKNGADMSQEEFAAAGGNYSLIHTDFMIGSQKMDVNGITREGNVEPVMRGGEWAF
jgi:aminopeptidase